MNDRSQSRQPAAPRLYLSLAIMGMAAGVAGLMNGEVALGAVMLSLGLGLVAAAAWARRRPSRVFPSARPAGRSAPSGLSVLGVIFLGAGAVFIAEHQTSSGLILVLCSSVMLFALTRPR